MSKLIKGPFTAHIRYSPTKRHPDGHTVKIERKTFKAVENALRWHMEGVESKWITNAEGVVYSPYARIAKATGEQQ